MPFPKNCSQQLVEMIDDFNSKLYNWIDDDYLKVGNVIKNNKLNIVLYERNLPLTQDIETELNNRSIAQDFSSPNQKIKLEFTSDLDTGKTYNYNNLKCFEKADKTDKDIVSEPELNN